MVSDEAKKKAREYVDANLSWDLCESSKWDEVAAETYLAGYNQGRADALKELKDRERKAFEAGQMSVVLVEGRSFNDYKKEQENK